MVVGVPTNQSMINSTVDFIFFLLAVRRNRINEYRDGATRA
jgi:hypothetical protein